jgi:nicotinamide-nucleotide amidase
MHADIVTIGDELLIGQVVNTNSSWIARELNLIGFNVNRITSVSDTRDEILSILKEASGRSKLVLITGGLGPTSDDITKNTLCEYFKTNLILNQTVLNHVESLLSSRNVVMNDLNHKQAEVLANCDVIFNINGTAPGMWMEKEGVVYVAMPGVPFEMQGMMEKELLPRLKKHFNTPFIHHFTILTQGIAESKLA